MSVMHQKTLINIMYPCMSSGKNSSKTVKNYNNLQLATSHKKRARLDYLHISY